MLFAEAMASGGMSRQPRGSVSVKWWPASRYSPAGAAAPARRTAAVASAARKVAWRRIVELRQGGCRCRPRILPGPPAGYNQELRDLSESSEVLETSEVWPL